MNLLESPLPGEPGTPFVVLDFELSDQFRDSACQIGIVRVESDEIVRSESRIVRPPRVSARNTRIHGITPEQMWRAAPLPVVWPELEHLLDGIPLLVAHSASTDSGIMRTSWTAAGLVAPSLPWACTVVMAKEVWPQAPGYKLKTLAEHFGIPLDHHNAQSDAEACACLVLKARAERRGQVFNLAAARRLLDQAKPAPKRIVMPQAAAAEAVSAGAAAQERWKAAAPLGPSFDPLRQRLGEPAAVTELGHVREEQWQADLVRLRYSCSRCTITDYYAGYSVEQARASALPKHEHVVVPITSAPSPPVPSAPETTDHDPPRSVPDGDPDSSADVDDLDDDDLA